MSDTQRGPGWWLASDGLWYPPELHADPEWRAQFVPSPAAGQGAPTPDQGYGPLGWAPEAGAGQPGWQPQAGPPGQGGWAPQAGAGQPDWGPQPAWQGPYLADEWGRSQVAGTGEPGAPPKRHGRRIGLVVALVLVLVAAAVVIPLALGGASKSSGGSSATTTSGAPAAIAKLPAAEIVAKTLAAAKAARTFSEELRYTKDSSSDEQITVARNGIAVGPAAGPANEVRIASTAYFQSPDVLKIMGVAPKVATAQPNATKWFSDPVSAPGVRVLFGYSAVSVDLGTLALTHPTIASATSTDVTLTGGFPAGGGAPGYLIGESMTLTVSGTAPYYPIRLGFSSSATETFAGWGAVSPLKAPSSPTPLGSILVPTADQPLLSQISVSARDLPKGYTAALVPGGEQVVDQVTLNYCSNSYPSETLRVDRRQVAVLAPGGDSTAFQTEAVVYKAVTDTVVAFAEIAAATAHCSGGSTPLSAGAAWPGVPGVQLLGYSTSQPEPSGDAVNYIMYLRRGSVLLGLYFNALSPTVLPFPVAGSRSIEAIVHTFEERLAALPQSAVG